MRMAHFFTLIFMLMAHSLAAHAKQVEPEITSQLHDILSADKKRADASPVKYNCPTLYESLDGVAQGNDGWFFRKSALQEDFEALSRTAYYMGQLRKAFKAKGSDLIFFLVPPRAVVSANKINPTQTMLDRYELDLARNNFTGFIKALNAQGGLVTSLDVSQPVDDFFYARDFHWKPKGARTTAQYLANVIKVLPFYKSLSPATFTTAQIGTDSLKTDLGQSLDRVCDEDIPAEPYPLFRTTKELGDGADALFGDDSDNGLIVLLGTSYSDGKYNFEGFLSEYTGMEVANFAISGGGLRNAMISYVTRPPRKRLDPDVIIWESLAHYDVNQAEYLFRQSIPAVHGECSEKDTLMSGKVDIKGGEETMLLDGAASQHIAGEGYYLFFEASNPAFVKMTLEMNYADGDGEWFPIDRSWRYKNTSRFFVQLSDALTEPLESIKILHEETAQSTISYRLCASNKIISGEGKTAVKP